ncbi:MAG TPA: DUF3147 family protein [Polyangiaceae bacterium]|nr:DUF3147 family protein [Polyangiaceae bacterium]
MSAWPEFLPRQLLQTKATEYLLRFGLGGAISAGAWVIASVYGPRVGGLFLAFPAILPASLTLVKKHDGRRAAADDARGAALGSLGLAAFAFTVATMASAGHGATWTLLSALLAWLIVSVGAWCLLFRPARSAELKEKLTGESGEHHHAHTGTRNSPVSSGRNGVT